MRFMILLRANKETESGAVPSTELLAAMGKYNEALVNAGVLDAAEGLQPTSKGVRVRLKGTQSTVTQGPFTDADHDIAGFWMFNVKSLDEAIQWVKRCPFPFENSGEAEIEIRQVFEAPNCARLRSVCVRISRNTMCPRGRRSTKVVRRDKPPDRFSYLIKKGETLLVSPFFSTPRV